jgi:hypothetical protein
MKEFTVPFEADEPERQRDQLQQRTIKDMRYIGGLEVKVRQLEQRCERLLEVCQELLEHGYWRDSYEKEDVAKRAQAAIVAEQEQQ